MYMTYLIAPVSLLLQQEKKKFSTELERKKITLHEYMAT